MSVLKNCLVKSVANPRLWTTIVSNRTWPNANSYLGFSSSVRCLGNESSGTNSCESRGDSKVKVLYDGHCPLCMTEIKVLQMKNKKTDTVEFIDITKPDYDPSQNANIGYDKAMEVMHVIGKDGEVHTKVGAMRAMYDAVGWGWMWNFTKNPTVDRVTDKAYMWFARNRLWLTGRGGSTSDKNTKDQEK